jgi:DNA-directed RNA polymerase specialized sigma24 family protein
MQDVWASFFTAPREKCAFDTPDQLVGFLAELAYRKVADAGRKNFKNQKSNLDRLRPLDHDDPDRGLPVRGPTPSQFAVANESWERMIEGQPPDRRLLLEMLRQGNDYKEIAERTGLHPKLIQRFLLKIAEKRGNP